MKRSGTSKALVLAVVLLGGCGGQDRPEGRTTPSASPSAAPGATAPSPGATGSAAPAPPSSPSPVPSEVAKGAPLARSAIRPADAADHLYDETGFQRVSGCFNSERPPPTPTKLRVDAPSGSRQQLVRDRTDQQGGMVATAVVEYRQDGVYLVYLRQSQSVPFASTIEFEPSPPVLIVPAEPAAQKPWSFTLVSKDGRMRVETSNEVASASEPATTGGGKTYPAMRVVSRSKVTGESPQGRMDLSINSSSWYSLEARLEVKDVTDTTGTVGLCEISSHEESVLR